MANRVPGIIVDEPEVFRISQEPVVTRHAGEADALGASLFSKDGEVGAEQAANKMSVRSFCVGRAMGIVIAP